MEAGATQGGHNQTYIPLLFWKSQPRHMDQKRKEVQIMKKKKLAELFICVMLIV